MKITKEKMFLKIELLPKEHPCHNCVKGCMGDEFLKCKELKAFENKKIFQAYEYDKAIEVMAQAICMSNADGCGRRCLQGNCCYYVELEKEAKAALKALLGVEK